MANARGILILVPTYNEAENVGELYRQIAALGLDADFLFLDDNSPDGTGRIIDELAAASPRVNVIHRAGKLGIGSAHLEGIHWAYRHGYTTLVTMDCDFTHSPSSIPEFLSHAGEYDLVIGSRFQSAGSLPGWNLFRRTLTHAGHAATRLMLKMPLDATGAFRAYRLDRIPEKAFDVVLSRGYSFFFESLYVLWLNGARVKEIPLSLPARTQGHSKMAVRDAVHSFRTLLELRRRKLRRPESLRCELRPASPRHAERAGR